MLQPMWRDMEWTDSKNERRCDLINRKHDGAITVDEIRELAELQAALIEHRKTVAPLPIEEAERLLKKLTNQ